MSILPYLLIYNNENKEEYMNNLLKTLNLIYEYIQSSNLDKLRISGLLCLDKIIENILVINTSYLNIFTSNSEILIETLKILFLLLNDEYPNIRKKACEIFITFNNLSHIVSFKNYYTSLTNEYICQKILKKIDINKEPNNKFGEYILQNNFYFRVNVFEAKIFYYEPDNNYIDNSQNKLLIIKNFLKNNFNSNKIQINYEEYKSDDKIMIVFEEFTDKIKNVCNYIINSKKEVVNQTIGEDDTKFIYKNIVRPKIYQ